MGRPSLAIRAFQSLAVVVGLVGALGSARDSLGATGSSLTIITQECPDRLALDGAPISLQACPASKDRSFKLIGPVGQEVVLVSRLQLELGGAAVRSVRWTINSRDDLEDSGEYRLIEQDRDPASRTIYECLKTIDGDLKPADLALRDGGIAFDWTPAVVGEDDVDGEELTCTAISRPVNPDLPATGIVRIHTVVANPEDGSDLIIRAAGDEPYALRDGVAADIPALTYTLSDDASGEIVLRAPETGEGIAINSFAVPTGDYMLTVGATGISEPVTVESGQTVLAFTTLGAAIDRTDVETAVLETPSPADAALAPTPAIDDASLVNAVETFSFSAYDWAGAFPNVDTGVYARDCVAVYGAGSPNATASITFDLDRVTIGSSRLVVTGLDDEVAGQNLIVITVNGEVIFDGGSPFESWDPGDPTIPWSEATVPFNNDVLVDGVNRIVVTNNASGGTVGLPPYILLSEARVEVGLTIDAG